MKIVPKFKRFLLLLSISLLLTSYFMFANNVSANNNEQKMNMENAAKEIKLPEPNKTGGMPLMEALSNRKSSREFSTSKELSEQQLSDLLWAMWGVNRADNRRTAPSARNSQAMELFVVKSEGVYKYNAKNNSLELVKAGDHRNIVGMQDFAKKALLNILLIANTDLLAGKDGIESLLTLNVDAGFISQNAYLYCASEGLNCVARLNIDKEEIEKVLELEKNMYPVIALTIGY